MPTPGLASRSELVLRLSPIDRFGRSIDPAVLEVAERIGQRAITYAEKFAVDPAIATNILEESASAVTRALRTKRLQDDTLIHDLPAYLFKVFIRRINKTSRRMLRSTNPDVSKTMNSAMSEDLERRILVGEFLSRCDSVTRGMFARRIRGFSWKAIGKVYGMSAHTAESRFSRVLQRVRKRLGLGT